VLSGIVRAAAQTLKTAWRSLVNTLTAAMTTVRSILAGIAAAMRAGISLLKAGIMAAIGFLSKLFSDGSLMLREFGQKALGALSEAAETVVGVFKNQILYWASWMWVRMHVIAILVIREVVEQVLSLFGVDVGLKDDELIHVVFDLPIDTVVFHIDARIYDGKYHVEYFDGDLWCIIYELHISNETGYLVDIEVATILDIIVDMSLQYPKTEQSARMRTRKSNDVKVTRDYMEQFWNSFKKRFLMALGSFIGCVTSAAAILEKAWKSGIAWAVSLGLFGGAIALHKYMDTHVIPSLLHEAVATFNITGCRDTLDAAIYLCRAIRIAIFHLFLMTFVGWFVPQLGGLEFLISSAVNWFLIEVVYPRLGLPLPEAPSIIKDFGYTVLTDVTNTLGNIQSAGFFLIRSDLIESFAALILLGEFWYVASTAGTCITLLEKLLGH